jgi:5-methylcytosine-specific restriction enzyme subunit McrC
MTVAVVLGAADPVPGSGAADTIVLREYQPRTVTLSAGDVAWLLTEMPHRIDVAPTLGGGFVVCCNQFVGLVMLPSGRRLECRPKVPVGTLFTMLAVAYDLDVPLRDDPAGLDDLDQLLAFVVRHFVALVDARLSAGFIRDYVEVEDNLPAVRGRIAIAEDVRRNAVLRHRTFCRYTEFTHDVPDNQVIRQVIHLLAGWPLPRALTVRLRALDAMMGDVTPTRFGTGVFARFRYDRLREGYRPIHAFCRLFMDGLTLEGRAGGVGFRSFLVDMNALFEAFVGRSLATALPPGVRLSEQAARWLDADRRVSLKIDFLLERGGVPALVADTKYKRIETFGAGNADVFQMLAYCVATGVPTAVLVYPREAPRPDDPLGPGFAPIRVTHAGVTIRGLPVDLSLAGDALTTEMRRVADELLRLSLPSLPASPAG